MPEKDVQDHSQRVRIGLTGLACVFLLVLLGAIIVKFVSGEVPGTNSNGNTDSVSSGAPSSANLTEEGPKEPLAELGVVPGNAPPEEKPSAAASESHAPSH